MKLNTAALTSSQPPHSSRLARTPPVRAVRRVSHSPATNPIKRGGKQPGRLGTHRQPEQPADARIAAEEQVARAPWTTWAAPGTATEGGAEVARAGIAPPGPPPLLPTMRSMPL